MSEDIRQEADSPAPVTNAEPPDIADDEDLDVVIEQVAPRKRAGCSGGTWVLFIIVLAAIAVTVGWLVKRQADETAQRARESRESTYQSQIAGISGTVNKAADLAGKGEIDASMELLGAAAEKWAQLAGSANGSKDVDRAQEFATRQAGLKSVIDGLAEDRKQVADLDAQIKSLTDQRAALAAKVCDKIRALGGPGSRGPSTPAASPEAPANDAPATEAPASDAPATEAPASGAPADPQPPAGNAPG
jgi:hypothetical protein